MCANIVHFLQFVSPSAHDRWTVSSLQLRASWLPVMWFIYKQVTCRKMPSVITFWKLYIFLRWTSTCKTFSWKPKCSPVCCHLSLECFLLGLQVQVLDAMVFPQPSDLLAMTTPSQLVLLIPFTAGWRTLVSSSGFFFFFAFKLGDKIQMIQMFLRRAENNTPRGSSNMQYYAIY